MMKATKTACCVAALVSPTSVVLVVPSCSSSNPFVEALPKHVLPAIRVFGVRHKVRRVRRRHVVGHVSKISRGGGSSGSTSLHAKSKSVNYKNDGDSAPEDGGGGTGDRSTASSSTGTVDDESSAKSKVEVNVPTQEVKKNVDIDTNAQCDPKSDGAKNDVKVKEKLGNATNETKPGGSGRRKKRSKGKEAASSQVNEEIRDHNPNEKASSPVNEEIRDKNQNEKTQQDIPHNKSAGRSKNNNDQNDSPRSESFSTRYKPSGQSDQSTTGEKYTTGRRSRDPKENSSKSRTFFTKTSGSTDSDKIRSESKPKQRASSQKQNERESSNSSSADMAREEDYYKIIGVPRTASQKEITKAYRRKCVRYHPDKTGGDRTMFDKLSEAYDVLSDEKKKSMYDRFGKKGLDPTGNPNGPGGTFFNTEDMFSTFFGGTGAGDNPFGAAFGMGSSPFGGAGPSASFFSRAFQQQHQRQMPRNRNLRYQLEVTLEDLYRGSARRVTISKPPPPPKNETEARHGRPRPTNKDVEIVIEKGMKEGEAVILSGEIDSVPDATPADVVFVLSQTRHRTFTRKNNDLAIEVNISLKEALCGWSAKINHLDARQVLLETDPDGNPIKDGDVRVLKGQGMPVRHRPGVFGDLYVQFRVEIASSSSAARNPFTNSTDVVEPRLTEGEREVLGNLIDLLQDPPGSSVPDDKQTRRDHHRANLRSSLAGLCKEYGITSHELDLQTETSISSTEGVEGSQKNPFLNQNGTAPVNTSLKSTRKRKTSFLKPASASDFGTSFPSSSSGGTNIHDDEEEQYRQYSQFESDPFEQFRFFSGQNGGGRQGSSPFSRSSTDGQNVQCQQM